MKSVRDKDGKSYQVVFTEKRGWRFDKGSKLEPIDMVETTIFDEHLNAVGWGVAIKSVEDTFDNLKGMKLSLRRATRAMGASKYLTKKFWKEFVRVMGDV